MEGFIKINKAFLTSKLYQEVKPSTAKVLFALLPEVTYCDRVITWECTEYKLLEGEAIIACTTLAHRCGLAKATVRRAMSELAELGVLEYSRVNQGYYVELVDNIFSANGHSEEQSVRKDPANEQKDKNTPYITAEDPRYISSKQTFERPKKNPKLKNLSQVKDLIPHSFTGPNTLKALEDWMAYKQERKEGYTATTFKAFMTLMQKEFRTGKELHDAVYEAIARQWRGVHNTYGGYNAR